MAVQLYAWPLQLSIIESVVLVSGADNLGRTARSSSFSLILRVPSTTFSTAYYQPVADVPARQSDPSNSKVSQHKTHFLPPGDFIICVDSPILWDLRGQTGGYVYKQWVDGRLLRM